MNIVLKTFIETVTKEFDLIPSERKATLRRISEYVSNKVSAKETASIIYVCTHNSRRSHFGQVWGKTAAAYYNIPSINTYSAGTEATAMNPNAILALKKSGFVIKSETEGSNPHYLVYYKEQESPISCFSKTYEDKSIPKSGLCAIMTCTEADGNCPVIPGTEVRISCPYEDPKRYDGTEQQGQAYDDRCRQIARENLYIFSLLKK